jgi:hypothetical protein
MNDDFLLDCDQQDTTQGAFERDLNRPSTVFKDMFG